MMLVIWQHVCSVLGRDDLIKVLGLGVGQIGVGLFLILSGYLAAQSTRKPAEWILARLRRLFPAYWIAIAVSLIAAVVSGYKPVSWQLALAQLIGIAGFTHSAQLVNVATWFISTLLLCYLVAFVLQLLPAGKWLAMPVAVILAVLAAAGIESFTLTNISIFLLGFGLVGQQSSRSQVVLTTSMLVFLGCLALQGSRWSLSICVPVVALWIGLRIPRVDLVSRRISELSYCIYLVHGPILIATAIAFRKSWWAVIGIGVPLSVIASVFLSMAASQLDHTVVRVFHIGRAKPSMSSV